MRNLEFEKDSNGYPIYWIYAEFPHWKPEGTIIGWIEDQPEYYKESGKIPINNEYRYFCKIFSWMLIKQGMQDHYVANSLEKLEEEIVIAYNF